MNKIKTNCNKAVAALALKITKVNANSNCFMYLHQPKMPTAATKLRKF